ncbi:MAG: NAD(P)-dependent oxidoreductase [Bacteroidetes bacterium]|nr:NAD(P)-dependent oxidoreductase [Bacteroidota bacterium]
MKILVTGGSGMVGKYIVEELLRGHHTVGVVDLKTPLNDRVTFHQIDILNLDELTQSFKGYDAVIHTAGIPHPLNDPAERVFSVNVNGTFNVLEAAVRNGIKKVVFTSSESTLGFAFMNNRMVPEYIPIDEQHPMRPQDPYGLSKVIGEQICRTYSARYGIRTVCLREPWIWVPEPEQIAFYQQLVKNYQDWHKNLWTYVHVFDVADAHKRAVEMELENHHEIFFITAASNWTGIDSRELLRHYYPEIPIIANRFTGNEAIISHGKAARLLGYSPRYSVSDLLVMQ